MLLVMSALFELIKTLLFDVIVFVLAIEKQSNEKLV